VTDRTVGVSDDWCDRHTAFLTVYVQLLVCGVPCTVDDGKERSQLGCMVTGLDLISQIPHEEECA